MEKKQKWNGYTPFIKGHKLRVGLKHTLEFKEKRKGEGNPNWKGDEVSLTGMHIWIRRNFEEKKECEYCGTINAKRYDWINLNHQYSRDRRFWKRACRSCHMKYDYKMKLRKHIKHSKETKEKISKTMKNYVQNKN